jgi:putative sigma-54 modulation protein
MAFPHINTKAKHIDLTPAIEDYLARRMESIERHLPQSDAITCDVELEKTTEHHRTGMIYRTEINLMLGGQLLRAEATAETIEAAIDEAKDELKRELTKLTDKTESMFRRGARKAKDFFRFGN